MTSCLPLDAVAGHGEAVSRLREAAARQRMPHAWLFHGPAGVGKATTALALVMGLLCQAPRAGSNGCGQCSPCRKLLADSHPDLVRVTLEEGKTQISVEQVRELTRFLSLTALESAWKVGVVDDASLMNDAAANALLKTLEEPPSGTLMILVTSRPGSLLPTIRSRCQGLRFGALTVEQVLAVVAAQAPRLDPAVAREAALLADGVPRVALALAQEDLGAQRRRFWGDVAALDPAQPARVSALAEGWVAPERFPQTVAFLQAWFRERIHASVKQAEPPEELRDLMELSQWVNAWLGRARVFNLNRQLLMEGIFIRLARWRSRRGGG